MNHQMEGPLSEWGKRTRDLKQRCLEKLGRCRDQEGDIKIDPRCRSPKCRWQNEDGSIGCNDRDALEFDHIEGGGSAQRTAGTSGGDMTYREILNYPSRFQLLCANCHKIKSSREQGGARQHKWRRSLNIPTG